MVLFRLDLGAPDSRQRRCSHGSCDRPAAARSLSAAIEGHTQNAWAANLDGAYVSCSPRYQKVISAPAGEPKLRPPKRRFAASGCCQRLKGSKAAASLPGAASFQRQSSSREETVQHRAAEQSHQTGSGPRTVRQSCVERAAALSLLTSRQSIARWAPCPSTRSRSARGRSCPSRIPVLRGNNRASHESTPSRLMVPASSQQRRPR